MGEIFSSSWLASYIACKLATYELVDYTHVGLLVRHVYWSATLEMLSLETMFQQCKLAT